MPWASPDPSTHWWREASLATTVASFLERVGTSMLDALDASAIAVRVLEDDKLETVASLRRDEDGVVQEPAVVLDEARATRVRAWIEAGRNEGPSKRPSAIARELVRGLDVAAERCCFVPLRASGTRGGVVLLVGAADESEGLATARGAIGAVLSRERFRRELLQLREAADAEKAAALERLHVRDIGEVIIGASSGLRDVMRQVEQVAATPTPVLILGETGSGKEVVARAIHERSAHAKGPILRVNCGAIPPELVDSELFGHERGSFTGAASQRRGWFERADGGTLFLDEVGELTLAAQVRLLRVVQDGMFERVGGGRPLKVDVRLVCATHRDLGAMVRAGQFREDLWYRINVFSIRLPPLRERLADIAEVADHFAQRAAKRIGVQWLKVTPDDVAQLRGYAWPGNVRELSAVIERAAILGEGKRLDIERALGVRTDDVATEVPSGGAFPTLEEAMRLHIERALTRCHGRIDGRTGAAALLDIHPNTLRSKMTKLGIEWTRFRP